MQNNCQIENIICDDGAWIDKILTTPGMQRDKKKEIENIVAA
jgi:hypothetical protein